MSGPHSLPSLLATLRARVEAPVHQAAFVRAQEHHASLQPYPSVRAVLAFLDDRREPYATKDAVTRALVERHQQERTPLWSEILLAAYAPMLGWLRARTRTDAIPRHEIDHLAVTAFLEVLDAFPVERMAGQACLTLRRRTGRRFFQEIRAAQRVRARCESVSPTALHHLMETSEGLVRWPELRPSSKPLQDEDDRRAQRAFLCAHAREVVQEETLELLLATLVQGESIRAYVQRLHPDLPEAEQERVYQSTKRRRARALVRLRRTLPRLPFLPEAP